MVDPALWLCKDSGTNLKNLNLVSPLRVAVGVGVTVFVDVFVAVAVLVGVLVAVAVVVGVLVAVLVTVAVLVGVLVAVGVEVLVVVTVGVFVGAGPTNVNPNELLYWLSVVEVLNT